MYSDRLHFFRKNSVYFFADMDHKEVSHRMYSDPQMTKRAFQLRQEVRHYSEILSTDGHDTSDPLTISFPEDQRFDGETVLFYSRNNQYQINEVDDDGSPLPTKYIIEPKTKEILDKIGVIYTTHPQED